MSYQYKTFELPEYKDPNWHLLLLPLLEWTIDNLLILEYSPVSIVEIGDVVYVGKENGDGKWLVKSVTDNLNGTYTTSWATIVNNPSYADLSAAMAVVGGLVYANGYISLLT